MNLSRARSLGLSTRRSKIIAGSALAAVLLAGGTFAISSVASAEESSTVTTATATTAPDPTDPGAAGAPADGQAAPPADGQSGPPAGGRDGAGGTDGGTTALPPGVTAVTGDELESVSAAVLAEYPGATVLEVGVDSDGAYHAQVTTADGDLLLVDLDADLTVTGSSTPTGPAAGTQGGAPPAGGASQDGAAATPGT